MNNLTTISPIDGRYSDKISDCNQYFSEFGLMKYRCKIEIEYFIFLELYKIFKIPIDLFKLRDIYNNFTIEDAKRIKTIESEIKHDVKAIELFLNEKFDEYKFQGKQYIHFGLTSQDINTSSNVLQLKDFKNNIYNKTITNLLNLLKTKITIWQIPILSHTHGQPATPTKMSKEIAVFYERIKVQINNWNNLRYSTKFGGATGGMNAHYITYPTIDWIDFANKFCLNLGLQREQMTTQISHYDNLSEHFSYYKRINVILIDLCRDIWSYISMNYFRLKVVEKEVGSSAMPHKVNPIDFENAEGNLMFANVIFDFMSNKLPISRLQRDLTDSTILRNMGVACSHTVLAIRNICNGLNKLQLDIKTINTDLENNWVVISEAIQNILRINGNTDAYNLVKNFVRNNVVDKNSMNSFINDLKIDKKLKYQLLNITPFNYGINK